MVRAAPMVQLVLDLLHGFERTGYQTAILLSGHYPNHREYLKVAVTEYLVTGGQMKVLALIENQVPGVGGDHAAKFETSSMLYLHPGTVDEARLKATSPHEIGGPDEVQNWLGQSFEGHPCYGLVGIDPRGHATVAVGRKSTDDLIDYLKQWVTGKTPDEYP